MSEQMQHEANQTRRSQLNRRGLFGVLIGLGAGIGLGHRLPEEAVSWVTFATFMAATALYYWRMRFDA